MTCAPWPLREVPAERLELEAAFRRCQALGWHVDWAPLPSQDTLSRFRQSSVLGELQCLVPTGQWAAVQWPQLPGLAWEALDEACARKLFDAPQQGPIDVDWLDHGHTQWLEQVTAAAAPPLLPCLHTGHGPVWVEQLHPHHSVPMVPPPLPWGVPVPVLYRLGQLTLPLVRLRALRPGDVVQIGLFQPQGVVQGRPLFSFGFNEGHMIINEFEPDMAGDAPDSDYAGEIDAPMALLDVAALPMTVDVVLCQLTHTVAELGQMQPGSTWPLSDEVHRQVELRVHGQRVAKGELVRVGDGLGVQIDECTGLT